MSTPDFQSLGVRTSANAPTPCSWAFKPSLDTSSWLPRSQAPTPVQQQRSPLATPTSIQSLFSTSFRTSACSINSSMTPAASTAVVERTQQQPQRLPTDVLLAPLLPSAEDSKLAERVSHLRLALDESQSLLGSLQQRNAGLQQSLEAQQQENHQMQLQLVTLRQSVALLGGNLQGRLSFAQGKVVAELQEELSARSAAIAASEARLQGFQAELDKISSRFGAKLAAEQRERERLAAEAAQSRLLCSARARQVVALQAELEAAHAALQRTQSTHQEDATKLAADHRSLLAQAQQAQHAAEAATNEATAARGKLAAAEAAKSAMAQQIKELQEALADMRLQSEWLEGKVADLENCDPGSKNGQWRSQEGNKAASSAADSTADLKQQLRAAHAQLEQLQAQLQQRQQQEELAAGLAGQLRDAQATAKVLQADGEAAQARAVLAAEQLAATQQQLDELRSAKLLQLQQAQLLYKDEQVLDGQLAPLPELSADSWDSVHDNPEFDTGDRDQHPRHKQHDCLQQQQQQGGPVSTWHSARIHDLEDTVSSLRRQLRAQEQAMAALHKQTGLQVHDSAASRAGWADALGLLSDELPSPHAAAKRHTLGAFMTEQHDELGAADQQLMLHDRAGGAGMQSRSGSPDSCDSVATQTDLEVLCSKECGVQTEAPTSVGAQNALLGAARTEIQRLKEINQQLLESHAAGARSSVSLEDAKKAVAQAKQAAAKKGHEALERANHSWAARMAALQADHAALEEQVKALAQLNEDMSKALATAQAAGNENDGQVAHLEGALADARREADEAKACAEGLKQRLAEMAESHEQELEQARMECESDAAATIMEANAAAALAAAQQQRAFDAQLAHHQRLSEQQAAELRALSHNKATMEQHVTQQAVQLQDLQQQRTAAQQQAAEQAAQLQAMAARVDELSATILQQQALLAAQPQPVQLPPLQHSPATQHAPAAKRTDAATASAQALVSSAAHSSGQLNTQQAAQHEPPPLAMSADSGALASRGAGSNEPVSTSHDAGNSTAAPSRPPQGAEQHNRNSSAMSPASSAAGGHAMAQSQGHSRSPATNPSNQPSSSSGDAESATSAYHSHQQQQQAQPWPQPQPLRSAPHSQHPPSWGLVGGHAQPATAHASSAASAWDALDADDDVCRVSSASATPSHTHHHHQQQQQPQRRAIHPWPAAGQSPDTPNSCHVPAPAPSSTPLQARAASYGSSLRLQPPSTSQLSATPADRCAEISYAGASRLSDAAQAWPARRLPDPPLHGSAFSDHDSSSLSVGGTAFGTDRAFDGRASVAVSSLDTLAQDVFGALSLSRYHKERSKVQEVRAAQHALAASLHEDAALRLRADRHLLEGTVSPGATAGSAADASPVAPAVSGSSVGLPPLHKGHALPVPSKTMSGLDHSMASASLYQAAAGAVASSQRTSMSLPLGTAHPGVAAAVERAAAAAGAGSRGRWQQPAANNRYTSY